MQDADRTVGLSADVKEIFLIVRESYAPVQGWRRRKQSPLFARLEIPDPQAVFARLDWHIRQQMRVRRNSHIQHMPVVGQADDLHGTKIYSAWPPLAADTDGRHKAVPSLRNSLNKNCLVLVLSQCASQHRDRDGEV